MEQLPLTELAPWLSDDSYEWIHEDDRKRAEFQQELEAETTPLCLFGEEEDATVVVPPPPRVQTWRSSTTQPDGVGGYYIQSPPSETDDDDDDTGPPCPGAIAEQSSNNNSIAAPSSSSSSIAIEFILSESYEGFGETLWASARHVANVLANPISCAQVLNVPYNDEGDADNDNDDERQEHPLWGKAFVELGSGAGVPSWTALKCGARVVSTDLASANRIRCLAESLERNYRTMQREAAATAMTQKEARRRLHQAAQARAVPCPWGKPVDTVLACNAGQRFDVVVAADCCYQPLAHHDLLDTIDQLLREDDGAVALVPFALHGNTTDASVWSIVTKAEEQGFVVEHLPTTQLHPPCVGMEAKQGLVHTLRLTRRRKP